MTKQIYITRRIPVSGLKILEENNIVYDMGTNSLPPTKKELIKQLKKKPYDGVISFLTDEIDAEIFNACPTVKVFANFLWVLITLTQMKPKKEISVSQIHQELLQQL